MVKHNRPPQSQPSKGPLRVFVSSWEHGVRYEDADGRTQTVDTLMQARNYAKAKGYSGITVSFGESKEHRQKREAKRKGNRVRRVL